MSAFNRWKAQTMARLIEIKQKYADNRKVAQDVQAIITRLEYARSRDLPQILALLHHASADAPEFLQLVPTADEVAKMYEGE